MSNEELVERIRNGYHVTENMQVLYENNLPLIKKFIKPYAYYEPEEDLLQEAYFCIFRKNCASVPEERSAIPLQTEQSSAG